MPVSRQIISGERGVCGRRKASGGVTGKAPGGGGPGGVPGKKAAGGVGGGGPGVPGKTA